ncbi:DNA-binding protein [Actinoplanes sp. NPDC026619]|uniref:DNA-binding protein n=1 Tax=Actinoplanes sp. NPDC026619 TaxID=3155798 RepID=UPI0033C8409B
MLRKTTKTRPQAKTTDPRADLVRLLAQGGQAVASACGTCGGQVRTDDPEAVQTTRQVGQFPYHRTVRSWRYHGVCHQAGSGAALLALALDPDARPVRVTQAHADVARTLGVPLAYQEQETASPADRGRAHWRHIPRAELAELSAAVDQRHRELTVPVPHASGWPCAVCGRSHELVDAWRQHQGRPVCGACSTLVERSQIPGNRHLWQMARDLMLAEARDILPARAITWPLPLAQDMPSYSRHDCKVTAEAPERQPWAYVADLPETPLTDEERQEARLDELERRLAGVTA